MVDLGRGGHPADEQERDRVRYGVEHAHRTDAWRVPVVVEDGIVEGRRGGGGVGQEDGGFDEIAEHVKLLVVGDGGDLFFPP